MNVLVVDDSRAMRRIMRKALAFAGVEGEAIREAEHGADALEKVRAHPPTLVLSDINMPVMAGDAFLDAMKEEGFLASIPVVVVTSAAGAKTALDLVRRGASRVIKKPFDPLSLHSQLQDFLGAPPDAGSEGAEEVLERPPAEDVTAAAPAPSGPPLDGAFDSAAADPFAADAFAADAFVADTFVATGTPADPEEAWAEAMPYTGEPEPAPFPQRQDSHPAPTGPTGPDSDAAPAADAQVHEGPSEVERRAASALSHTLEVSLMEASTVEASDVPANRMLLASSIEVRVPEPAELTLLCTYEVATRLAIALVGDDPAQDDGERLDALAELSNMVAGTYVDRSVSGGVRPEHLGLPVRGVVLPGELLGEVWQLAQLEEPEGAVYVRMVTLPSEVS